MKSSPYEKISAGFLFLILVTLIAVLACLQMQKSISFLPKVIHDKKCSLLGP